MSIADFIAQQLLSVQPIPDNTFQKLIGASKTTDEPAAEGYEPVEQRSSVSMIGTPRDEPK